MRSVRCHELYIQVTRSRYAGPHYTSVATVGLASALVLTNACLSFCLSLGIGMSLIVAAVRHACPGSPVHCGSFTLCSISTG